MFQIGALVEEFDVIQASVVHREGEAGKAGEGEREECPGVSEVVDPCQLLERRGT